MLKLYFTSLLFMVMLSFQVGAQTTVFSSHGRTFRFVSPTQSNSKRPLMVLLHGCKQDSKLILDGSNLEEEALKRNFFVLVPEQSSLSNSDHCWNWFYSQEQVRGFGEMDSIIQTLEILIRTQNIDREKIYLAGLSAGGALAHSMMNCYPDYFTGVAIQSGLAYKVAENIYEAQMVLTSPVQKPVDYLGSKAAECSHLPPQYHRLKKSIIIHGEDDTRVNPLHAELISASNEIRFDVLDDGVINHSLNISSSEQIETYPHGYSALIKDKSFNQYSERLILIKGMKHAWGGGKPLSANFDPDAPSTTNFIIQFFNL